VSNRRSKPFLLLAVFGGFWLTVPAMAQESDAVAPAVRVIHADPNWESKFPDYRLMPEPGPRFNSLPDYRRDFGRASENTLLLPKSFVVSSPDTIEKMESAFYCNDTPFIDQVRLPVAAWWHGRVRLTGFESDVTTANFVLGLPGAGTLTSLSLTGSGHLATKAPPSDQLVGMHLTFSLGGAPTASVDNSGLHGLQYLARGGRNFLQDIFVR
jgi:hypothetical protein